MKNHKELTRIDSFLLQTKYGVFKLYGYEITNETKERYALALVKGEVKGKQNVFVRIHSQCIFSEIFGAYGCDCNQQLSKSLKIISKKGGVLVYLDQEGRGHGLITKIKEFKIQQSGYDTYEASIKVGERPDNRNYKYGIMVIKDLEIKSIKLMTNNPEKIQAVTLSDIHLTGRIPLEIKPNKYNRKYLKTKKEKFAHLLNQV